MSKIYLIHYIGIYPSCFSNENELTLKVKTNKKDAQKEFQKTKKEILEYYRSEQKDKVVFDRKEKNFIQGHALNCEDEFTISLDEIEVGDNSKQIQILF